MIIPRSYRYGGDKAMRGLIHGMAIGIVAWVLFFGIYWLVMR